MFKILSLKSILVPPLKILVARNCVTQVRNYTVNKNVMPCLGLLKKNPSPIILVVSRNVTAKAPKFNATNKLETIKRKDGVPKRYDLIYRSDLVNYFGGAQLMLVLLVAGVIASMAGHYADWRKKHAAPGEQTTNDEERIKNVESQPNSFEQKLKELRKNINPDAEEPFRLKPTFDDITDGESETTLMLILLSLSLYMCLSQILRRIPVRMYTSSSGNVISVHLSSIFPGRRVLRDFQAGTLRQVPSKIEYFKDIHFQDPNGHHYFLLDGYFRQPADLESLIEKRDERK